MGRQLDPYTVEQLLNIERNARDGKELMPLTKERSLVIDCFQQIEDIVGYILKEGEWGLPTKNSFLEDLTEEETSKEIRDRRKRCLDYK